MNNCSCKNITTIREQQEGKMNNCSCHESGYTKATEGYKPSRHCPTTCLPEAKKAHKSYQHDVAPMKVVKHPNFYFLSHPNRTSSKAPVGNSPHVHIPTPWGRARRQRTTGIHIRLLTQPFF
jgi:hypothetical protein